MSSLAVARRFPRPDVDSTIRKLPSPRLRVVTPAFALPPPLPQNTNSVRGAGKEPPSPPRLASPAAPSHRVEPLSADRYRIQLNASAELKQKLERAADLLSHANPSGDLSLVIERALDLLIERVEKERFAQTKLPRRQRESALKTSQACVKNEDLDTRARKPVPNAVKRRIASLGRLTRCTFVGNDGQRCAASRFTQIHHEKPWARGGAETVDNLRMLCASHNRLLAERDFGREVVAERIAKSSRLSAKARISD